MQMCNLALCQGDDLHFRMGHALVGRRCPPDGQCRTVSIAIIIAASFVNVPDRSMILLIRHLGIAPTV